MAVDDGFEALSRIRQIFGKFGFAHYLPATQQVNIGYFLQDGYHHTWSGDTWEEAYENLLRNPPSKEEMDYLILRSWETQQVNHIFAQEFGDWVKIF